MTTELTAAGTDAPPAIDELPNAAEIFNWSVTSYAISAAWELGVLDYLAHHGAMDVGAFSQQEDLDPHLLGALLRALAVARVVTIDSNATGAVPGAVFEQVERTKALFHWLHRGSGNLLAQLGRVARGEREGTDRNPRAIGAASSAANAAYFEPVFRQVLSEIEFSGVADLGCGTGERLVDLARDFPGSRGIGLEIAPQSVAAARAHAAAANVGDRVSVLERDVTTLEFEHSFADVNLITCFLLGHDFWPRARASAVLAGLRQSFPSVQDMVFCDTVRDDRPYSSRGSIFYSGFELVHAAMGRYVPTIAEWQSVFAETGWRCRARHDFDVPSSTVLFHLVPDVA
jgi:SAM-dependent methyltransferase